MSTSMHMYVEHIILSYRKIAVHMHPILCQARSGAPGRSMAHGSDFGGWDERNPRSDVVFVRIAGVVRSSPDMSSTSWCMTMHAMRI